MCKGRRRYVQYIFMDGVINEQVSYQDVQCCELVKARVVPRWAAGRCLLSCKRSVLLGWRVQ